MTDTQGHSPLPAGGLGSSRPVVTLRDVTDGYRRRTVFQGFNLEIPAGITVLLGPNGAGKSTLLNLVAGLRTPRSGSITVTARSTSTSDGADAGASDGSEPRAANRPALLPQSFGYLKSYTVQEFVSYVAWMQDVPAARRSERVAAAISAVDLDSRATDRMRTLSGGMVQRAGIASALVASPELLLLDEPAAGLDPVQRIELQRVLTRLTPHTSTVLSTHLAEDVEDFAAAVVVIDRGELLFSGTPAQLIARTAQSGASRPTTVTQAYLELMKNRPSS